MSHRRLRKDIKRGKIDTKKGKDDHGERGRSGSEPSVRETLTRAEWSSFRTHMLLKGKDVENMEDLQAHLNAMVRSGRIDDPSVRDGMAPLDKARDIVYEAWGVRDKKARVTMAHKALALSKDCADAYLLLSDDEANGPEEALRYVKDAVQAGKRALPEDALDAFKGQLWGDINARPYMRALEAMAQLQYHLGTKDEAIGHFKELLKLNENDNQGIRYQLLDIYMIEGMVEEATELMGRFKTEGDFSAQWAYYRYILAFRKYGPGPETNEALDKALKMNPHVPIYLLGNEPLPDQIPDGYSPGSKEEAVLFARDSITVWTENKEALFLMGDRFMAGTMGRERKGA